ncbi:MAG: hypothetical protein NC217_00370 [Muribaculaceae bacterium]|nr:hypothetical protein [Muribaculaceae bacterium]
MVPLYDTGPKKLHCYKMQGLGNDYIYMLGEEMPAGIDLSELARSVSNRHFLLGSDVMINKQTPLHKRPWG